MKKPIIYLKIIGNAGNQFFQYAFARNIQERIGGELYIDYEWARTSPIAWGGCDRQLDDFNIANYTYVTDEKISYFHRFLLNRISTYMGINRIPMNDGKTYTFYKFCAKYLERFGIYFFGSCYYPYRYPSVGKVYIQGYFESARYFHDIDTKICDELTPKYPVLEQNLELYDIIENNESVCISIKRMDIEDESVAQKYWYDINYFYNAVQYLKSKINNPVWVVFSDNVEWCKDNFHIDGKVFYETSGNPIWEKIRLMSSCKHFVIHNSTFSWWAQHLSKSKNKIVIAPSLWVYRTDGQPTDIYEEGWIYMTNDGEVKSNHD